MLIHGKRIDGPVNGQKIFNAIFIYDINTARTFFMVRPSANKLIDTMHFRILPVRLSFFFCPDACNQASLGAGRWWRRGWTSGMHLMAACQCQTTKVRRKSDWGGWKPKEKCWKMCTASMAEQKRADKFICNHTHTHIHSQWHTKAMRMYSVYKQIHLQA